MTKGYWIVQADVSDMEKFSGYTSKTPAALSKFGGRVLVKAGKTKVVEGSARSRNTVIEFPSYKHALDCWNSSEYQSAKTFRVGIANLDIVIIEGCS